MYASVDMERESHLASAGEPRKGREQPPSPLAVSLVVAFIVAAVVGGFSPQPSASAAAGSFVSEAFFAGLVLSLLGIYGSALVVGYMRVRQEREQATWESKRQHALEIEALRAQDKMLGEYFARLSELLSSKQQRLHATNLDHNLATMVRAWTLALLKAIDGTRKGSVVTFLYEAGLINTVKKNFTQSLLSKADLSGALLARASLASVDLSGADLSTADLSEAMLLRANLRGAVLSGADLSHTQTVEADLTGANLSGANLRSADLRATDLSNATLNAANLYSASLMKANLPRASLRSAILAKAKLIAADLTNADLSQTQLSEAILGGAELAGADLSGADLTGASLSGANLHNAKVSSEQLNQASYFQHTTMPDGRTYEEWIKDKERRGDGG